MSTSRSGAALLLALLTLAACGAPEGVASRVAEPPAPAATPALVLTPADLEAALPGAAELHPWRVVHRCAGRDPCTRAGDGRTAFVLGEGARLGETVLVGATRWPTAAQAAAVPARALSGGRFRTPVEQTAPRSWRLGEAGRATVTPYAADGWVGRRREAVLRLLRPGGGRSPPLHEVGLVLTRDRVTLQVTVRSRSAGTAGREAAARLSRLLTALAARAAPRAASTRSAAPSPRRPP